MLVLARLDRCGSECADERKSADDVREELGLAPWIGVGRGRSSDQVRRRRLMRG